MFDNISNPNDHFVWGNAFNNTYRGNNSGSPIIKQGKIVNVTRQNHLAQTYDVEELESGALLKGCKYLSPTGGFNGTGNFSPLEEGTPVTLGCANGMWDEVFITGVFYTEGNYDKYYKDGELQKPGDILNNAEFNQTSPHPNRIVDPNSTITLYGVNNLFNDFMSPEFTNNLEDKAKANKQVGVIDLITSVGDKVHYAFNTIINYTSNIINVAEGTAETKCAKLVDFSNYYSKQADLLAQTAAIKETPPEKAKETTGLKPIVTKESNPKSQGSLRSPFTTEYFIDQYRKLSQMYLEQAQACNRGDASRQLVGLQMQAALGTEQSQGIFTQGLEGQQTKPDYRPKEEKANVAKENYGERIQTGFKPLIVLHETVGNAESVINLFQNPKAQVSYHVMIKLDGTLVYFTDSNKRAFGAAPSQFKGEFEERIRDDGRKVKSVNSFAYHISFETPLDGQFSNESNPTHSGYTEAQYNSVAWLTAKTGVPLERITTHKEININQSGVFPKIDPRSFDRAKFEKLWNNYPKTKEIFFGIKGEDEWIKTVSNNFFKNNYQQNNNQKCQYKDATQLVQVENGVKLHPDAAKAFVQLKKDAQKENIQIILVSGFRSIAQQQAIIDRKRKEGQSDLEIFKVNAKPGFSEHHTGYAMDLDDGSNKKSLTKAFETTKAFKFIKNNAAKYGLELSYPKNSSTGILYEPWHWRFIGNQKAKNILYCSTDSIKIESFSSSTNANFNIFLEQIKNKYNLQSIGVKTSTNFYGINSNISPTTPASTIKLIVADLILDKLQSRTLSLSTNLQVTEDGYALNIGKTPSIGTLLTVEKCLIEMLKNSTNLETNVLIKNLGGVPQINNLLSFYPSTRFVNYLNISSNKRNPGSNQSTVIDLSNALNRIYTTNRIGTSVVRNALENNIYKFSYSNAVANKVGFTSKIIGNIGLVNINNKNYIISMYANVNGFDFNSTAKSLISKATQDIINFIKNSKDV